MTVRLRGLGAFCRFWGEEPQRIELPDGSKLGELMAMIHERWGQALPPELWSQSERNVSQGVIVLVAGKPTRDMDMPLEQDQEVLVVKLTVGG